MGNAQKQSEITKYAADLIRHKAYQLVGKAGFTRDDVEDIQQDMIVDLLPGRHVVSPPNTTATRPDASCSTNQRTN